MTTRRDDPTSIRWRLAATVGPEMLALALTILFALGVLIVVRPGSPSGAENRSPDPSSEPSPTGSTSVGRLPLPTAPIAWSWPKELDPT